MWIYGQDIRFTHDKAFVEKVDSSMLTTYAWWGEAPTYEWDNADADSLRSSEANCKTPAELAKGD